MAEMQRSGTRRGLFGQAVTGGGERWGPGSGEGDWGRRSVAVLLSHTHTHTVPSRAGDSIVDVAAEVVVERRA